MEFIKLLKQEIKEPLLPLFILVAITGISNAALLSIINTGAEFVSNQAASDHYFILFIMGLCIFIASKRYVFYKSTDIVEMVLDKVRYRIANKIRHAELATLETIGTAPIYARLTQDASMISNLSKTIIDGGQSVVMVFFALLYIASISILSFFIVGIGLLLCGLVYAVKDGEFFKKWKALAKEETKFQEKLGHILTGFKEIRINRSKNESVLQDYAIVNEEIKTFRVGLGISYLELSLFSQTFFYLLLGAIVFIIPYFHAEHAGDVLKVTATILFIAGPVEMVFNANQFLGNANSSTRNILELEASLEKEINLAAQNTRTAYEQLPYDSNIQFNNLMYAYPPSKERDYVFEVGPINLTLKKGEIIFITGGNGSGKSTFLKLLTGLYQPKSGEIWMDVADNGTPTTRVASANYQQYRNLFTTIFTDFHLFDKLYGVEVADPNIVNELLVNMELSAEKTTFKNGGFTNIHLSSGQKKRLALTTSIIEDKDIYIFDEVAADLDPGFRDTYYYEILQELKARNKTVIVVSHDRYYWTVPDRLLEMTNGRLRELSRAEIDSLLEFNEKH